MATPSGLHRRQLATVVLVAALSAAAAGCGSHDSASPEGGLADAQAPVFDLCDAFTGAGTACLAASPLICFPMCDSGGCFCKSTPDGPQWGCVTDTSCEPTCAPLDDACAPLSPETGSE
jgi:hypothetical protein